ncbi:MAG: dienelactone hydrolase [Verrucomicrobiales bacterium]|jgi:dienelactone hydrolase
MRKFLLTALLMFCGSATAQDDPDPLLPIFESALRPTLEVMLERYAEDRRYTNADFPMRPEAFAKFREDLKKELAFGLNLDSWLVREPEGKASPIEGRFRQQLLKTIEIHGITAEVITVTIEPSGLAVPMVVCLPDSAEPRPAICCFSGHTKHGIHDQVVNLDSYQQGIAIRLAKAGFVAISVEKIDTGYLSRNGTEGVDETELATLLLGRDSVLRAEQLKACIAAVEIAAAHPRVDEMRIGATGVSLGGWLSIQTALLNDRISAVADFGRKTRSLIPGIKAELYKGQADLCHVVPGLLKVCDRNLHPLALAPRKMLAGHGIQDAGSQREAPEHFRKLCEAQYKALGASENYRYLIHEGGDTMPSKEVAAWFAEVFELR